MVDDGRAVLQEAAEGFLGLVAAVPADGWDRPGLGEWTVRELVGHTGRAFLTVRDYLASPAEHATLPDAATYFAVGLSGAGVHEMVAERGREAGLALGDDPLGTVGEWAGQALAAAGAAPDDTVVGTSFGGMRLLDYLPTRVFELTVHGLDLARALGLPPRMPARPLAVTAHLVTDLALVQGHGPDLVLALTGRSALPASVCVV